MSIKSGPHFEVASDVLAEWIERQGASTWWNVDGDPMLTGRLSFPCPGDELSDALRRLHRPLLIQDPKKRKDAKGQSVAAEELDSLADLLGNNVKYEGDKPIWADDRIFYCCWKGSDAEWLLEEDTETTVSSQKDNQAS